MTGHSNQHPRVRVAAIVPKDDSLLLVRHRKGADTYWLLPGGGLDYGEQLAECAAREVAEETGLSIEIEKPLFLSEAIAPDKRRHILSVVVLARLMGGEIGTADDAIIEEVAFVPFADLPGLTLYPAIADEILAAWKSGFEGEMRYLGALWT